MPLLFAGGVCAVTVAWIAGAICFSTPATPDQKAGLIKGVENVILNIEGQTGNTSSTTSVIKVNGQTFGAIRSGGNDAVSKEVTQAIRSADAVPLIVVQTTRGKPGFFSSSVSTEDICGNRSPGVVTLHRWWQTVGNVVKSVLGLSDRKVNPDYPAAKM